jgi:hypothetical protein
MALLRRAGIGEVERKVQKSYWEEHSKDLTVESMMLDSRAADLDKEERPEVRRCMILSSSLPPSVSSRIASPFRCC